MYTAMKYGLRGLLVWAAAILVCSITAFGATDRIDTVKLTFSYNDVPKAGDPVGTLSVRTASKEFTVKQAEYTNDTQVWEFGDIPLATVTLAAEQGFQFYYTSSSHFDLSGSGVKFKRARVMDNGSTLELEVQLKQVAGKVDEPQNLEWDSTYAMWDEVEGARKYEVHLYRNRSQIASVTTKNTAYDFRDYITKEGDYTFRVRGISRYDGKPGGWSDFSDDNTYTDQGAADSSRGTWIQNQTGWWYRYDNGDYPTNCWKEFDGKWYYFNGDGYMLQGWQSLNGRWYYLDGSGVMLTGWQLINGKWYYLEPNGPMDTGWQHIEGNWYYLDPGGAMLTGWQDISGQWYFLNDSGVMLTGWQFINGYWFLLNDSGVMLTGWQNIGGQWYFLNSSGVRLSGWQDVNDQWYYFSDNGIMLSGRQFIDGKWYNLGNDGVLAGG